MVTLLVLLVGTTYGQELPHVYVGMKDSLYQEFLSRDIFSDVRLQTDSVVYTPHLSTGQTVLRFDGQIRYKGNSTRYFPKKGHQIKFSKATFPVPTDASDSLGTLTLNPMYTDKSFVREAFVWACYGDLGTMAPRTSYVQFHINTDYKGLYLQVDKVDRYLIKNWGRNNKCQMFEAEDYYCKGTLDIESDSLMRVHYLPELPATDVQYDRLKLMILQLNLVDSADFVQWFDQNFETKSVMDWFAVNILSTSGDSYNKNYFLYNDTTRTSQQWTIIPWDYDLSMGRNGDVTVPYPNGILSDLFVYTYNPLAGPHNVLKDRFMQSPVLMERLRVYMDSLFTNVWTESALQGRIDGLAAKVRPYIGRESQAQDWGQTNAFEEQVEALKYYITVRRNFLISTFTHPIGGEYHMATIRIDYGNVKHAIAIDGRQVASLTFSAWNHLDSLKCRVHSDSLPPYFTDTTRGYINRWLEITPYPSTAAFSAKLQWSWNEYDQEDSEVRTHDERGLQMHCYRADGVVYSYSPVPSTVNAYGNFAVADISDVMCGPGHYFAMLNPGVTSVTESGTVAEYALEQNYPNPFNPSTTIRYGLPSRSHITLTLCNTLGQQVATIVQGEKEAGYHEVKFEGTGLSSGVYFCRMTAGDHVATKKLLLMK